MTLQEVIRAVRHAGAKSSHQAGVHVHLDCSGFDGKSLINLAKLYHKQEALILKAFGVSEQRMNRYAKPMNPEFIARIESCRRREVSEMNRLWYGYHRANPGRYDPERYYAAAQIMLRWAAIRGGQRHIAQHNILGRNHQIW